jgi:hypothetical protein
MGSAVAVANSLLLWKLSEMVTKQDRSRPTVVASSCTPPDGEMEKEENEGIMWD